MRAVRRPGEIQQFGRLAYIYAPDLLRGTLLLFMPSGRFLAYPEADIAQVTKFDQPTDTLVFVHPEYGPSATYGGALVQGATQGEAASLLRTALVQCDKAGIESIGQVHDEIIIEHPINEIDTYTEKLVQIMETPPDWASGLPLNADAEIGYRYKVPI
jgi:DNA polymerase